jgi:hypothetical protein
VRPASLADHHGGTEGTEGLRPQRFTTKARRARRAQRNKKEENKTTSCSSCPSCLRGESLRQPAMPGPAAAPLVAPDRRPWTSAPAIG